MLLPEVSGLPDILHLVLSLVGMFYFIRFRKTFHKDKRLLFAAAICLTLWVTPHALVYEWTLLLFPAIILWEGRTISHEKLRVLYAILWIGIIVSGSITNLQLDLFSRALQISIPALTIQGSHDPVVNPVSGLEIFKKLTSTDKSLYMINTNRHGIVRGEKFIDIAQVITDFLDRHFKSSKN